MSETFIIDWPVLAFFGFLFGGGAPRRDPWRSETFLGGLIATGGFTASAVLSNKHAPDWMWMYFRDPEEMAGATKLMPMAYFAAYGASFLAAQRAAPSSVARAVAAALTAEVAVVAATWDRYHRIGTKEEWEQGRADELIALKPRGKAKQVAAYVPLVMGTFGAGVALSWRERRAAATGR